MAVLLSASSSRYEGDWPSIRHSHAFTELFYVRDGQGDFLIEDEYYPIAKDDLVIINPQILHTELSKGQPPLNYLTLGIDGVGFSFRDHQDFQILNCRGRDANLLFYFQTLFRELDKKEEGYDIICRHMLEILMLQLRRITDSAFELMPSQHPQPGMCFRQTLSGFQLQREYYSGSAGRTQPSEQVLSQP